VRAARIAAERGAKVMVAEEYRLGGTCVIRGCVPKKLFVYASRFHGEFEDAAGFGWTVSQSSFDLDDAGRQHRSRDRPARSGLWRNARESRRQGRERPRRACRCPHRAIGEWPAHARRLCAHRDWRGAELWRSNPRLGARYFLERGVPFVQVSAAYFDSGGGYIAVELCATPVRGFPLQIKPSCFRSFSRPTMPLPARRVALAWDLLYRSASLRCTAAKSGSSHSVGKAQHLRSRFRSSLSGRWRPHEQAHSSGGGSTG
jgi:hypothetical protein